MMEEGISLRQPGRVLAMASIFDNGPFRPFRLMPRMPRFIPT